MKNKTRSGLKRFIVGTGITLMLILGEAASIHLQAYGYLQARDGGGHCLICLKTHVVHNYEAIAGLKNYYAIFTPEGLTKLKGEPLEIIEKTDDDGDRTREYVYDGFSVFYDEWIAPGKWTQFKFTVYDPAIKFSRTVHVGSTRDEIIEAYKHIIAVKEYALGEGYFDIASKDYDFQYERCVHFTYDENDIVTSITYLYTVF